MQSAPYLEDVQAEDERYYIPPEAFKARLSLYASTLDPDILDDLIQNYFMVLAEHVVSAFGCGYADAEDLTLVATEAARLAVLKWSASRGTPFNFFTKVMRNRIRDERRKEGRWHSRNVPLSQYLEERLAS